MQRKHKSQNIVWLQSIRVSSTNTFPTRVPTFPTANRSSTGRVPKNSWVRGRCAEQRVKSGKETDFPKGGFMDVRAPRHNAGTTPLVAAPLGMASTKKMDLHVIDFNRLTINSKAIDADTKTPGCRGMKQVCLYSIHLRARYLCRGNKTQNPTSLHLRLKQ